MKLEDCPHYAEAEAAPRGAKCEGCGSTWNLRACTTCGHVGCCESQQAHNTKHSGTSGHPVIRQMGGKGREGFLWCYTCGNYLE